MQNAPERAPAMREVLGFRVSARALAVTSVALAMAVSALVVGLEGDGQTFKADEWGYAVRADSPLGEALFQPPASKYLLAVPMLFYKALFETAGLANYFPYRALGIALVLVCAGLFFALARRGLGNLAAVPPTVLLLFFGSAWDVVVTPLRIPALFAIAAGLGMLLCLERRDRQGDLGAAALLTVSLASHPTSLAFAVAAAVMVLLRPSQNGRRPLWVFGAPIGLYAAWWLFVRNSGGAAKPELGNLTDIPVFLAESFTAVTAAISGAATLGVPGVLGVDDALTNPLTWVAALALAIAIAVGLKLRSKPLSPLFWALLAGLLALWAFTALAPREVEVRPAASGRYLYPGAILLLLLLAEVVRGTPIPRAVSWVASLIVALGIVYNVSQLEAIADGLRRGSDNTRAYIAALELVRGRVDDRFLSQPAPSIALRAGAYFEYSDRFGTPAYSPDELTERPSEARSVADRVFVEALQISLEPAGSRPAPPGPPPMVAGMANGTSEASSGCVVLRPGPVALTATLGLSPGGVWLRSRGINDLSVSLGRFGAAVFALTPPPEGGAARLSIPVDGAPTPWSMSVSAPRPVEVCGLGA